MAFFHTFSVMNSLTWDSISIKISFQGEQKGFFGSIMPGRSTSAGLLLQLVLWYFGTFVFCIVR